MSDSNGPSVHSYRQSLKVSAGALLIENGFDSAENMALETVTELLQSFLRELGRSSRAYCELACRTEVLGADVIVALSEMGHPPVGIKEYALRTGRRCVGAPTPGATPKQPSILHTGDRKRPAKSQVLEGMPEFPDSHSYIRTPTHKQPQADYESVREKAASQKRDVERALSRFIAKTCGKNHQLFDSDDANLFPLISCTDMTVHAELFNTDLSAEAVNSGLDSLQVPSYMNALLFRDQIFEEDEREFLPKKKKASSEEIPKTPEKKVKKEGDSDNEDEGPEVKTEPPTPSKDGDEAAGSETSSPTKQSSSVDNPFLKPVRMPRTLLPGVVPKSHH